MPKAPAIKADFNSSNGVRDGGEGESGRRFYEQSRDQQTSYPSPRGDEFEVGVLMLQSRAVDRAIRGKVNGLMLQRLKSDRMRINTSNVCLVNMVKLQRAHGGYLGTQRR